MKPQDMAIVRALVSVAWADGVFHEKEREMVEALIAAFRANEKEAKAIRAYAAQKRTIDDVPIAELSADDRRVVIQHAVLLMFVDGDPGDSERKFISDLCKRLDIPEAEAKALVDKAEPRVKRFLNLL